MDPKFSDKYLEEIRRRNFPGSLGLKPSPSTAGVPVQSLVELRLPRASQSKSQNINRSTIVTNSVRDFKNGP